MTQCYICNKKKRVKFCLCLIKHHAMKAYGRMETELHAFFMLTLGGVSGLLYTPVASHQEKTLCWYTLEWASVLDWI